MTTRNHERAEKARHLKNVDEFLVEWMSLEGAKIKDAVCRPELLTKLHGAAHVALSLLFPDQERYFYVDFWIREIEGQASPFVLLNTRVSDRHGSAHSVYPDIIGLLRDSLPPFTLLVTFVRQSDTLELLERDRVSGTMRDPNDLPLVRMFKDGGWGFYRLTMLPESTEPRRRYLIRFETLP